MHWRGGGTPPPPPLQGAQPMPSHCLPDAKCQLQRHLQPTVTAPIAFATASNRLPDRFWGCLWENVIPTTDLLRQPLFATSTWFLVSPQKFVFQRFAFF